jgi:propanediol dehydratase small subunit
MWFKNFRNFKTPAEWNSSSQDYIIKLYNLMSPNTKKEYIDTLKQHFPQYF